MPPDARAEPHCATFALWTLSPRQRVTLASKRIGKAKVMATHPAVSSKSAEEWAQKNLEGWPPKTIALAVDLIKKYGEPNDAAPHQITWYENGPWKRTAVFKEGVPHKFPKLHEDVLEQTVDYRVPLEK